MKWWFRKMCAGGLLAGVLLSTGSCADNQNMLVIEGAMSAQPPSCIYMASASALVLSSGIVDVAFGGRYTAVLLVSNHLAARGSKARLRAESSDITIDNAVVRLLSNGEDVLGEYSVPASGNVPVASGEEVGYGAIAIDMMPGGVAISSDTTGYIIAEVRLQGKTSGGADIESNLFRYEIYVVDSYSGSGLVSYNSTDSDTGAGTCNSDLCSTASTTNRTYCYAGQDSTISCCDCYQRDFCRGQ